jgi:TPR repeat protein
MKKIPIIILFITLSIKGWCSPNSINPVSATLLKSRIQSGDFTYLNIRIIGSQHIEMPNVIDASDLQIRFVGVETQVENINSQFCEVKNYNYIIMPLRTGKLTVPSVAINIYGNKYATDPISLEVQKGEESSQATQAIKWCKKAADQGDAEAQCQLGNSYLNGLGVTINKEEAIKWFKKSAEQGNIDAKNKLTELGISKSNSSITTKPEIAREATTNIDQTEWSKLVKMTDIQCEQNDPRAMGIMSCWIRLGLVKYDLEKSTHLAIKSAEMGNPFGMYALARIYHVKDPQRAVELYDKAFNGLNTLADSGDIQAKFYLSCYYMQGFGTKNKNRNLGIDLRNAANIANNYEAADAIALDCVARNQGDDQEIALDNFIRAAKKGLPSAQYHIAKYGGIKGQKEGLNIPLDQIYYWLNKSIEQGYAPAQCMMGEMLLSSEGIKQNKKENTAKGLIFLEKAAEQENAQALFRLAEYYANGDLVEKDIEKAKQLFTRVEKTNELPFCIQASQALSTFKENEIAEKNKEAEIKEEKNKQNKKINDFLEKLASSYGSGKDNCYQVVIPQLIGHVSGKTLKDAYSIDDKIINHNLIYGKIQRLWTNKNNLFMDFSYDNYNYDINDKNLNSLKTSYTISIEKGGEFFKLDDDSNLLKIGYRKIQPDVQEYDPDKKKEEDPYEIISLSQKQIAVLCRVYPTFTKWAANFRSAGESNQTLKGIERPFVFIWTGNSAKIGIISESNVGDRIEQAYSEGFLEDVMYCISQIPELQNMLFTAQKSMINSQSSAKSRVEELTR